LSKKIATALNTHNTGVPLELSPLLQSRHATRQPPLHYFPNSERGERRGGVQPEECGLLLEQATEVVAFIPSIISIKFIPTIMHLMFAS
jgi:hypothetical protein